jgi:hypothetical protein
VVAGVSSTAIAQVSLRGTVAFVGDRRPFVQVGGEDRGEVGSGTSVVDSMGVTHLQPTKWLWSGMALVGATWVPSEPGQSTPRLTGQAQLGVLYRVTSGVRAGVYGVGLAEPRAVGALVRLEPMSAAAFQAGWVHRRVHPADVAMVQVDLALSFLTDLLHGGGKHSSP